MSEQMSGQMGGQMRAGVPPMPPVEPGFDDPIHAAQRTFRAALDALAHPGRVLPIAETMGVPPGLSTAMTALLLTLVDGDTPLWLPPGMPESTRAFLRFHCGCPLVAEPHDAAFVAVPAGYAAPALSACAQGDPAYPDRSATLLIEVDALAASPSAEPAVTLRGPGIEHRETLHVDGLSADFRAQWRANHARFPLGVDLLLTCGDRLCGLPRTTHMEG